VFSSDLARAVDTVDIAFAGYVVPVLLDWRLRECDYGELGHVATQLGLDHHLRGIVLEEALSADFPWRPGWEYVLDMA
jgi:2,3-bisphosphoglycerate-dependent phosphoglycerate mutase